MRIPKSYWSLIAAIPLLAVAVGSEPGPQEAKAPGWFSKLDRDGSGTLDAKEAGRFLAALDIDADGTVTVAEALAYVERRQQNADQKGNRQPRGQMIVKAQDLAARNKTSNGLWVVSIGHSCVAPAINPCIAVSRSAGYEDHAHLMQFFGGAGGAPRAQWMHTEGRQQAKPALATGKIDAMTFGHLVASNGKSIGCDVEDYDRWIEFAMKHNPDIKFFIQDLWPWLPGPERGVELEDFNLEDYEAAMAVSGQSLDSVVETLANKYPGRVHVLPAGLAMTELVRRFTNDDLPGVDALLVASEQKKNGVRAGLYRDKIHPTSLIAALQGYIYYACLYGKNPVELESGFFRDNKLDRMLRQVAWKIVREHPYSGVEAK